MEAESKVCITEDEAQLYDRQVMTNFASRMISTILSTGICRLLSVSVKLCRYLPITVFQYPSIAIDARLLMLSVENCMPVCSYINVVIHR